MRAGPAASLRASSRRRVWLLLALALLLGQTLGLMHRALHAPQAQVELAHALLEAREAAHPSHHVHGACDHGPSWLADLFATHDAGDPACHLSDPLNPPHVQAPPMVTLPALPAATLLVEALGDFVARWASLFDARGPPAPR